MVPNRTLQASTALSRSSLHASLIQDIVRRMQNCCEDITSETRAKIISDFAQKIVNSGHSNEVCRKIVILGLSKYMHNRDMDSKPKTDPQYRPIHLAKTYEEHNRQLHKQILKDHYYKGSNKNQAWRLHLDKAWRLNDYTQRKIPGTEYTTVMEIPNTPDSKLLKEFTCREPKMAKITKYQVK